MNSQYIDNFYPVKNKIKFQHTHYSIKPMVVRANTKAFFTVTPLYERTAFADGEYSVTVDPVSQIYENLSENVPASVKDGVLTFEAKLGGEQEYNIYIKDKDGNKIETFLIYALEDDLFTMRPYKADMHIHSYMSDGKEDPVYVASAYRKMGYDIISLTDHHRYEPSRIAVGAYSGVAHDMTITNGEEIHAPENPVHIVNFGGSFSVNELIESDRDSYMAQVREIMKTVTDFDAPENEIYMYASSKWVFTKIREGGGIGIFCHPFWRIGEGYHISERLTEYIFDKADFDAYEVVGGYTPDQIDSNAIQIAKYNDRRAKGDRIPIVGVSDSHGCDIGILMSWYSTMVFAKSPLLKDIREAVIARRSVAMETLSGEAPRIYGEFRYVKFAYFALREIFPFHDILCSAEGALMYEYSIMHDEKTAQALSLISGRTAAYLDGLWGKD